MIFTSFAFLFFFMAVLLIMGILSLPAFTGLRGAKARRIVLLLSSYFFYIWWDWRFCFLLLGLTLVAYITALHIEKHRDKKLGVIIGVAVPLLILAVFKYTNFFIGSFCAVFGIEDLGALKIMLPLGISFYTFQSIGYTIDVYRGKQAAVKDFLKFAIFVSFFPTLISGPIMKAKAFFSQLEEDRKVSLANISAGAQIFLFGLMKKIVLADHLSVFVNEVYGAPAAFHSGTVLLATISYSLQLYFDFSGYSDMAIGCAKCLGYDLQKNFNIPYISRNVSEFWKRWHISLSSWLMEYLYFSIGGNRKGQARTYINLITTMVLGGLWHGASWEFVIWGLIHGVMLAVHKMFLSLRKADSKTGGSSNPAVNILKILSTFMAVNLAWVFFRAETWELAMRIIGRIFIWQNGVVHQYVWSYISIAATLVCVLAALLANRKANSRFFAGAIDGFYPVLKLSNFWNLVLVLFATGLIFGLAYTGSNPFIYFQF